MKRLLAAIGLCIVALPCWSAPVKVMVDGKEMPMSPPAMLRQGRVFMPYTAFRKMGFWVSVRNSREVYVGWPASDYIIKFWAGADSAYLRQGVLMIPLRDFLFDGNVGMSFVSTWDQSSRTVHVHRAERWLRMRLKYDAEMVREQPHAYSHIWLGTYRPASLKEEIARAERLDQSGDSYGAIQILERIISGRIYIWPTEEYPTPDEWLAYEPLGVILTRRQPSQSQGYLYLGIGRALRKDYQGAEEAFRHGVELDPANADLQFAVGWTILRKESVTSAFERKQETLLEALGCFEKALEVKPEHEPCIRSAGYSSLHLAYLITWAGGYTEESRAKARPYLEKADQHLSHLRKKTYSERLDGLISTIRKQLGEP